MIVRSSEFEWSPIYRPNHNIRKVFVLEEYKNRILDQKSVTLLWFLSKSPCECVECLGFSHCILFSLDISVVLFYQLRSSRPTTESQPAFTLIISLGHVTVIWIVVPSMRLEWWKAMMLPRAMTAFSCLSLLKGHFPINRRIQKHSHRMNHPGMDCSWSLFA